MKLLKSTVAAGLMAVVGLANASIVGYYQCVAHNASGHPAYQSHLSIEPLKANHQLYELRWHFKGGKSTTASGFVQSVGGQEVLSAVFHAQRQAPGVKQKDHNGIISYIVSNDGLSGMWYYAGSAKVGSESCKPDAKPSIH